MADQFILEFAKLIADKPEEISVSREDVDEGFSEIIVRADKVDTGKLIGKDGKMISSLKSIISGCKAKEGRAYRVTIKSNDEQ
ncbi:MAG: KH domain-containing protein [Epsilonproteobacteria bacterium]|nr:KH domain-containing protein [Campylobacterota bacterium]